MSKETALDLAAARIIAAQHGFKLTPDVVYGETVGYYLTGSEETAFCSTLAQAIEFAQKGQTQ